MTGAEHYAEAERLLKPLSRSREHLLPLVERVAVAQVHATLALAAATEATVPRGPRSNQGFA